MKTAPKDGTIILVCGYARKGYYVTDTKWGDDTWLQFDPMVDEYIVESDGHLAWMPLPPPPRDMEAGR